jgi:hypothetical protein
MTIDISRRLRLSSLGRCISWSSLRAMDVQTFLLTPLDVHIHRPTPQKERADGMTRRLSCLVVVEHCLLIKMDFHLIITFRTDPSE